MILQSDPAWALVRLGCVSASRIADLMAQTKSGPSASRANYMSELIVERLTGAAGERFVNGAMQWGLDMEPQARAAYEFYAGANVAPAAWVTHPQTQWAGATPDGFIGDGGLLEIKCPNTATHIETLLSGEVARKYQMQMAWQMACTGRAWCDFVSFDPRLPEELRLFVRRYERDDTEIAGLESAVCEFLVELDGKLAALKARLEERDA